MLVALSVMCVTGTGIEGFVMAAGCVRLAGALRSAPRQANQSFQASEKPHPCGLRTHKSRTNHGSIIRRYQVLGVKSNHRLWEDFGWM